MRNSHAVVAVLVVSVLAAGPAPGQNVKLLVVTNGAIRETDVKLGELPL